MYERKSKTSIVLVGLLICFEFPNQPGLPGASMPHSMLSFYKVIQDLFYHNKDMEGAAILGDSRPSEDTFEIQWLKTINVIIVIINTPP